MTSAIDYASSKWLSSRKEMLLKVCVYVVCKPHLCNWSGNLFLCMMEHSGLVSKAPYWFLVRSWICMTLVLTKEEPLELWGWSSPIWFLSLPLSSLLTFVDAILFPLLQLLPLSVEKCGQYTLTMKMAKQANLGKTLAKRTQRWEWEVESEDKVTTGL